MVVFDCMLLVLVILQLSFQVFAADLAESTCASTVGATQPGQILLQAQVSSRDDASNVVEDNSDDDVSMTGLKAKETRMLEDIANDNFAKADQDKVDTIETIDKAEDVLGELGREVEVDEQEAADIAEAAGSQAIEAEQEEEEEEEEKSEGESEPLLFLENNGANAVTEAGDDGGDAEEEDDDDDEDDELDVGDDDEDEEEDDEVDSGEESNDEEEDEDDAFLAVTVVSRSKAEILSCIQACNEDSKFGLCASDCVFDFPAARNATALLERDGTEDGKPRRGRKRFNRRGRRRARRVRRRKRAKRAKRVAKKALRKAKRALKIARKTGRQNMKRLWKLKGTVKKCYSSAAVSCAATTSCYPYLRQHSKHLRFLGRKIRKLQKR